MTRLPDLLRRLADDPRPDGELLAAFRHAHDEAAFAALLRRHGGLVWGVCRRSLPDPADAEDAFQASFLVLVRRAGRLSRAATVGPWLHRTAVLVCRNLRRKNARRLARTGPLPADVPAPISNPGPDIDALLLALSERDRSAVVLCCLQGHTRKEAADRLGVPEGTVSARLSRGLAKLRTRFAGGLPAIVFVPPAAADAALRTVTASRLAAVASPGVLSLADGVRPMTWLKKLAAGATAAAVVALGVGGGLPADRVQVATAAPAPVVYEPTDPISQLLRLEAAADRLARLNAAESEHETLAERRRTLLGEIDHKTRANYMLFVAVRVGPGGPEASVYEYDRDGRRLSHATGSLVFLERYLDRARKTAKLDHTEKVRSEVPHSLALHVESAVPLAVQRQVFAACRATGWGAAWMTATLPAAADRVGEEHPQSGGSIRYRDGRALYQRIWVSFGQPDDRGLPTVIPFDMRC